MSSLFDLAKNGNNQKLMEMVELKGHHSLKEFNKQGLNVLHLAAKHGNERTIELIMEYGVSNANVKSKNGFTALHLAAKSGYPGCCEILLEFGALIEMQNWGRNALHFAAMGHHPIVCEVLLSNGADPNQQASQELQNGEYPLHYAVDDKKTLEVLLRYGADVNLKNDSGQTAVHLAYGAIKQYLQKEAKKSSGSPKRKRDSLSMTQSFRRSGEFSHVRVGSIQKALLAKAEGNFDFQSPLKIDHDEANIHLVPRIELSELKLESDVIGTGAFGVVQKGTYQKEQVAVKFFAAYDKQVLKTLCQMLHSFANCNHRNLVYIIGYVNDPKQQKCGYVMELMQTSLKSLLEARTLTMMETVHVGLEIAKGLHFLSQQGIGHQELKPVNILLKRKKDETIVKLCDYGAGELRNILSKLAHIERKSLCYLSPESLDHSSSNKEDIYTFGLLLNEMMTGEKPYDTLPNIMVLKKSIVLQNKRPQISAKASADMKKLISHCWHSDPKHRPSLPDIIEKLNQMILKSQFNQLHKVL